MNGEMVSDNELVEDIAETYEDTEEDAQVSFPDSEENNPNDSESTEQEVDLDNSTKNESGEDADTDIPEELNVSGNDINTDVPSMQYPDSFVYEVVLPEELPFWEKPFSDYTASEGILFLIFLTMIFALLWQFITKR